MEVAGRNPLIELQTEVLKAVKDCTGKKECAELVKVVFKAKEPAIYNSTCSIWFKKYEAEAREKLSLERNAENQTQSSKTRSSRLLHETEEDCDLLPERDIVGEQHQSGLPHLLDRVSQAQGPNSEKPCRDSVGCTKKCQLLLLNLEEKTNKVKSLSESNFKLNAKNELLISQNNMCNLEIARLETANRELHETMKLMDNQILRIINDNQDTRKNYMILLDEKRREVQEMMVRISELESQQQEGQGDRRNKQPREERQFAPNFKVLEGLEKDQENSSLLLKRLLEENRSLNNDLNALRQTRSISIKKDSLFQSAANMRQSEVPQPSSFDEDFSVSKINGGIPINRQSSNEDTIQNLRLLNNQPIQEVESQNGSDEIVIDGEARQHNRKPSQSADTKRQAGKSNPKCGATGDHQTSKSRKQQRGQKTWKGSNQSSQSSEKRNHKITKQPNNCCTLI